VREVFEVVPNTLQKVQVASMHMQGRPETWVQGVVREGMGWNKFLNEDFDRFDQEGEWKLLKQWSDVERTRCRSRKP
jgi:hypothetical protein